MCNSKGDSSAMTEERSYGMSWLMSVKICQTPYRFFFSNFLVRKLRSCWDGTERVDDALPLAKRGPLGGEALVVAYQNRAGGPVIN